MSLVLSWGGGIFCNQYRSHCSVIKCFQKRLLKVTNTLAAIKTVIMMDEIKNGDLKFQKN
jgi:hypothetical protein